MINLSIGVKVIVGIFLIGAMVGCVSSGASSGEPNGELKTEVESQVAEDKDNLTLEDYLRRLGGVQVRGSGYNLRITIRGKMSVADPDEQPLFVLNGREVGNSYPQIARLVSSYDIKSVRAIPTSQASGYGVQGGAGVIEIVTE